MISHTYDRSLIRLRMYPIELIIDVPSVDPTMSLTQLGNDEMVVDRHLTQDISTN